MRELSERLQSILDSLPHKPGIYLHKDAEGHVLYVGKATSLHSRVRSYFGDPANSAPRIARSSPRSRTSTTSWSGARSRR